MSHFEEEFWNSCRVNDLCEVERLLGEDCAGRITLEVNWQNPHNYLYSPLHIAAAFGREKIIRKLLRHPRILPNIQDTDGEAPIHRACINAHIGTLEVLLSDPRINCKITNRGGKTALWQACYYGLVECVELLLAKTPQKDLDVCLSTKSTGFPHDTTPLEAALKEERFEVIGLLTAYEKNPAKLIWRLKLKLKFPESLACELFLLVVLVSDNYLEIPKRKSVTEPLIKRRSKVLERKQKEEKPVKKELEKSKGKSNETELDNNLELSQLQTNNKPQAEKIWRFFKIGQQLPLELQMVLCNRICGISRDLILASHFHSALMRFAEKDL